MAQDIFNRGGGARPDTFSCIANIPALGGCFSPV